MYLTNAQDPQAIADYVPIKQITACGVAVPDKIQNDVCYTDGRIYYHRRTGRHALTPFDRQAYTDLLKRIN